MGIHDATALLAHIGRAEDHLQAQDGIRRLQALGQGVGIVGGELGNDLFHLLDVLIDLMDLGLAFQDALIDVEDITLDPIIDLLWTLSAGPVQRGVDLLLIRRDLLQIQSVPVRRRGIGCDAVAGHHAGGGGVAQAVAAGPAEIGVTLGGDLAGGPEPLHVRPDIGVHLDGFHLDYGLDGGLRLGAHFADVLGRL